MAGIFKHLGGETLGAISSNKAVQYVGGPLGKNIKSNIATMQAGTAQAKNAKQMIKRGDKARNKMQKELDNPATSDARREVIGKKMQTLDAQSGIRKAQIDAGNQQIADGVVGMGRSATDWITAADKKAEGAGRAMAMGARVGAVAGASVLAGTGIRAMNGGGLTYNNQGERDIAGIPFI